jgi:hypothetical protein
MNRNVVINIIHLNMSPLKKGCGSAHCTENPVYEFPEMKLRGFVPNSYIHVSVSNLCIPRIGLPIWMQ